MVLAKFKPGKGGQEEVSEEVSAVNDAIKHLDILSSRQSEVDWTKEGMLDGGNRKTKDSEKLQPLEVKPQQISKSPLIGN